MNGKLVKTFFDGWTHYYLKDTEGRTIASTNKNYYRKGINKLSFKNCETIETGYDITKLCEEDFYIVPPKNPTIFSGWDERW